jgi:hypothetical protein
MMRSELMHLLKKVSPNFQYYPKVHKNANASIWFKTKQGMDHVCICAIPDRDIPEHSRINKHTSEVLERGWKAILSTVASKKINNGRPIVDRRYFWKVLHNHGIWSVFSHPEQIDVAYSWKWSDQ